VRICEYEQPLIYGRFWDYVEARFAVKALVYYLALDDANEPDGWIRAVDFVGGYRVRRARVGGPPDGERIVVEEEPG
jgi:hypothetical protein